MSEYVKLLDIKFAINDLVNGGFKTVGWGDSLLKICSNYAINIVHCKDCVYCEQDLIVERSTDGYERKINLCHVSKPPKVVENDHYCGYGERTEE